MQSKQVFIFSIILILTIIALPAFSSAVKSAFYIADGNRWEYAVYQLGIISFDDGAESRSFAVETVGESVDEVSLKEVKSNGETVFKFSTFTKMDPGHNTEGSESKEENIMLANDKGIFITATRNSGSDGRLSRWVEYNPPLVAYIANLIPGKKWAIGTYRQNGISMPMAGRVTGTETVTVPAGTFEDCLKIHITSGRITGEIGSGEDKAFIESGKSVATVWFHPSAGVVLEDAIVQIKMHGVTNSSDVMTGTHRETRALLPGYRVSEE